MNQAQLEALLGRPLTPTEVENLDLYIDIAYESLDELLCTTIDDIAEIRKFYTRAGYSTAFIGLFRSVSKVELNGTELSTDKYTLMQWDKFNGSWYNSLVFTDKFNKDDFIEVTAEWGFSTDPTFDVPSDLQLVLANLFSYITKKNKQDTTVENKKVEDFSVSFNVDADLDDEFYNKFSKTIAKYGRCNIPNVQSGAVGCGC